MKIRPALLYPMLIGGCLAGYFAVFRHRKSVDYVFEGREERMEEGRKAAQAFRQQMEAKLQGTNTSSDSSQQ